MPEKIHVIAAGSRLTYEVVESEDGLSVTIRHAEDHEDNIVLIRSVIPTLVNVLREISP